MKSRIPNHPRLWAVLAGACGLAVVAGLLFVKPAAAGLTSRSGDKKPEYGYSEKDHYPELRKKIVPIISVGSNLNVGAAQVVGAEADVNKVRIVAQLETDYKDVARIKILVPVQSERIVQRIDRVPGVSVFALVDVNIR
jgi:hypothetical protein